MILQRALKSESLEILFAQRYFLSIIEEPLNLMRIHFSDLMSLFVKDCAMEF